MGANDRYEFQERIDLGNARSYFVPVNFDLNSIALTAYDDQWTPSFAIEAGHESGFAWANGRHIEAWDTTPTVFDLHAYPNPAARVLYFQVTGNKLPVTASLLDSQGRLVQQMEIFGDSGEFNMRDLAKGIYLLHVQSTLNDGFAALKVVKQ